MDSKEKFNAKEWDSLEEVNQSGSPKYEFEESEEKQSKSFSATDWFVENEENIDENIKQAQSSKEAEKTVEPKKQKAAIGVDRNDDSKTQPPNKKRKRTFVYVIIALIIVAALIIVTVLLSGGNRTYDYTDDTNYSDSGDADASDNEDESDDEEQDYWEGVCGDNATFEIINSSDDSTPYYVLWIEGEGEMWNEEDINWKVDDVIIKVIVVCEGITTVQENQFSTNAIFDNVERIDFGGSVSYIGKNACADIDSLIEVDVDNENCDIDYIDDEGCICNTLGNTEQGVTIFCYEGSTAEEYVETWNSNYSNSYELEFY